MKRVICKEKIDELVKKWKERGFVSYDEINNIFDEETIWSPYLEELFSQLASCGIDIIEEEEKITEKISPLELYLRDIAKIPVLSREKEIELSKKIENAKIAFAEMARKLSIPLRKLKEYFASSNIQKELKEEFERIDFEAYTARREMIEGNLRLVVMIAKRYSNYTNMPLLDLISSGNIGLIRAVDRFDYKEGHRFSTYAAWWIRQAIITAINNESRIIKIPKYIFDTINHAMKIKDELKEELGRDPKMEEIAQKMGFPLDRLKKIMSRALDTISLETPIDKEEENGAVLAEIIEDKDSPSPADIVSLTILQENISSILNTFPEREREIIILRFGLFGNYPHTYQEISERFNLSKEGVRQIEKRALLKMKKRMELQALY